MALRLIFGGLTNNRRPKEKCIRDIFYKLGKPLTASFEAAEGGEKIVEIKKAAQIGLYLGGFFMDSGSTSVSIGGDSRYNLSH